MQPESDTLECIRLREGLDFPVSLVSSSIRTRKASSAPKVPSSEPLAAPTHLEGRAILHADKMTESMRRAINETNRRRAEQVAYNEEHGITPGP